MRDRGQFTRDNHFVPQWYLKPWADSSSRVWTYRLLVSHAHIKTWEPRAPKGIGLQRNLYTDVANGLETDEFEHWLEREFEAPAREAIELILSDRPLRPHHLQHLGRYAICQQQRTPRSYIELMERWNREMPDLIQRTLEAAVATAEECFDRGEPLPSHGAKAAKARHLEGAFKIHSSPNAHPETDEGEVGVELLLGKNLWIRAQRHLLDGIGWRAALLGWAIAEPADGMEWFTSDQPVAAVGINANGISLGAGWGSPSANIMMPLSPRHLLFAEIGRELPRVVKFDEAQTNVALAALAKQAHRVIFANRPRSDAERLRPRIVNPVQFQEEAAAWAGWHEGQVTAHNRFYSR